LEQGGNPSIRVYRRMCREELHSSSAFIRLCIQAARSSEQTEVKNPLLLISNFCGKRLQRSEAICVDRAHGDISSYDDDPSEWAVWNRLQSHQLG
jgi:hypothetical protein